MPAWLLWLIAAGVLAIAEVLSLDLILIMCAGAAGVTALAAGLGASVALQFVVFAVSALGMLFVVRPAAQRHLVSGKHTPMGIEGLIGKKATVLRTVDRHGGLVKLHGEEWTARAYDPHQVLEVGSTVDVMEIQGATALVWGEP
ncbi:MAG TPA: NfeD family protein [Mycobacteriales bacterium]|nr:NfeD family protein [Mycobacteriales bacterium]